MPKDQIPEPPKIEVVYPSVTISMLPEGGLTVTNNTNLMTAVAMLEMAKVKMILDAMQPVSPILRPHGM